MTPLDLHDLVPDPPDDLLDWSTLNRRIRRRRVARQTSAAAATAVIVAGAIIFGVSISGGAPTPRPLGPPSHRDGRVVFGQDTSQVTKTNLFADTSLYSLNPRGGRVDRLTHQTDGISDAVASPDGQMLAYTQETYGRGPAGHPTHVNGTYVHIVHADGSGDQRIFSCPSSWCGSLVWSPDSQRLLIRGTWVSQPDGHVSRVCVGECTPRNYTSEASWSPDGTQLAFQYWKDIPLDGKHGPAGTSTAQAIGVMNADGSHPRLITDQSCTADDVEGSCFTDTSPIWSPTGNAIAFTRTPLTYLRPNSFLGGPVSFGPGLIEVVRSNGSEVHQVVDCGVYCSIRSMSWSPTGQQLAYVVEDQRGRYDQPPWTLNTVDPNTRERHSQPLTFLTEEDTPQYVWSPSGTRIAIGGQAGNGTRHTGIYVVQVDGGRFGALRLLTRNGLPPLTWLPDTGS